MGERSGLGQVEVAILESLDNLGARPDRGHFGCAKVLAAVEKRIGLAPGYAYQVLIDLALPWKVPVPLVDGRGNFGSRGSDPAANPRYTEARLSPAGQVALAAERGAIAPVPVGLINGNSYQQGTRPPLRPAGVLDAVRQVIARPRVTSSEITAIIGAPDFLTGCTVSGDLAGLAAGRPAVLRLQARVSISDDAHVSAEAPSILEDITDRFLKPELGRALVVIDNFPPYVDIDETCQSIANRTHEHRWAADPPGLRRRTRLPLADLRDLSAEGRYWFVCVPERGTSPELLRDQLADVYGVYDQIPVALPRPLATMVRKWVRASQDEDLRASLTALEKAIASARPYAE